MSQTGKRKGAEVWDVREKDRTHALFWMSRTGKGELTAEIAENAERIRFKSPPPVAGGGLGGHLALICLLTCSEEIEF
jgi:hypothetical protein